MTSQGIQEALSYQTCQICEENEAFYFCRCTGILYCRHCSPHHHAKYPHAIHQVRLVSALGENLEEYRRRSEELAKAAAELWKNVERAEQFAVEFAEMMQNVIDHCVRYRSWKLKQLDREMRKLQTVIKSAIEEANACLDLDLQPVSTLGRAVWSLSPEQLPRFTYTVSTLDLLTLCQSWAQHQNNLFSRSDILPHDDPFFAAVSCDQVELYNVNTERLTRRTLPVDFGNGGSYIALDRHSLLCLGGNPKSTSVYRLDLPSLQLTSLPPLRTARDSAGVAKTPQFVYVFGGKYSNSCEKYALEECEWMPLSNMKYNRSSFTPCTFRTVIYLASSMTTLVIESFSTETEIFIELPVLLPVQMHWQASVAFVLSKELCVLTSSGCMGRWNIEREREFRLSVTDKSCWSCQQPLFVDSRVLISDGGRVKEFNLESYTFI